MTVTEHQQLDLVRRGEAVFCPDRIYRYRLSRTWGEGRHLNWLMLNPSSATAHHNDPTVTRCERFGRKWGYGGIVVTNIFAFRATDPRDLQGAGDPIGPENDRHILEVARECGTVVCAWGEHGKIGGRGRQVVGMLHGEGGIKLICLDRNQSGQPVHPLYQPKAAEPQPFSFDLEDDPPGGDC